MRRFNDFDLALRDQIRVQARHNHDEHEGAAIGACAIGDTYESILPPGGDYSLSFLDKFYTPDTMSTFAVAGQTIATLTMNPTDMMMCPVAVALVGVDGTDPSLPRVGRVYGVDIRGCQQLPFTNTTETVAAALQFVPTQFWDPAQRSGCACPINWGCYSSQGVNNARMTIRIGNPHPAGTTATYTIVVYARAFTCCPGFTDEGSFYTPRQRDKIAMPVPVNPPAPAGRIAAFARG